MLAHHLWNLLRYRRISPVEYYVCDRFRVVYVENAKAACTAIKQVLFPEVDYERLGQEGFHEALRARATFAPPRGQASDYLHFSFFRDPLARLESCWRDKIQGAGRTGKSSIFHMRFHRVIFSLFGGVDIMRPDLELADFIGAVTRIPDCLRDRHVMSQVPIFRAVLSARRHFLGRQETFDGDWAALCEIAGLAQPVVHNRSGSLGRSTSEIPALTRRNLRRSFKEDYRHFEALPCGEGR